jgi:hypothetical protein
MDLKTQNVPVLVEEGGRVPRLEEDAANSDDLGHIRFLQRDAVAP